MTYIIMDIGGTKTRVATSDDLYNIKDIIKFNTELTYEAGLKSLKKAITDITKGGKIQGIAIGIRGPLNEDRTGIENDIKLTDWAKKPIVTDLEKEYSVPVIIENDTALAGLGEAVMGAGQGLEIVAYHTISTGVGGVKIENGVIDSASFGFEPGHQIVDVDRTVLGQDITPTLENLVSGTALENRMGVKPYDIPQSDVVWDELAEYLASGLRNTTLYWSPDAIILGGSMIIGDPRIEIEPIRKYTVAVLDNFVPCPFITTAKLGDDAGLYGAMVLLRQRLEEE